ncbi:flippase [Paenibacillus sp. FSL E2-0202]|jgi:O-antigen/teichoic acid export membrane protein
MQKKSLVRNFIYNLIYTGLNLLFPLITAPYVSRVLGATNLGKVNFASTVVNWFVLFAAFGVTTYGVREVAKIKKKGKDLDKLFSEIFIINGVLSIIVTIIYLYVIFNVKEFNSEFSLFLIMSLSIILNMFSIDWFYQGIEEYRYITIRSTVFKVISLICIFLFVKEEGHYVIFGLISILSTSLSGILNFIYSRKFVKIQLRNTNFTKHFKPLSIFFVHTFIVNIYTNLDQVLLGFLVNSKSVAFMNRSNVVINMAISVSTSISNVTLPRASYYRENNNEKFRNLLSQVPNYILWITIPITVGCMCYASNIMYILGGKEFLETTVLLQIMSIMIIFSPLSTFLQYQVLVASGKEKLGLYCAVTTSLLSLGLNIILIPVIGLIGAGIVRVVSEFFAVGLRYYIAKKKLNYIEVEFINKSTVTYLLAALIMGGVGLLVQITIPDLLLSFLVGIVLGGVIYLAVLVIMREQITMFIIDKAKKMIFKR